MVGWTTIFEDDNHSIPRLGQGEHFVLFGCPTDSQLREHSICVGDAEGAGSPLRLGLEDGAAFCLI